MAEGPGCHAGGIQALLELIEEHRAAFRIDLLKLGVDLDELVRDERWAVGVDLAEELQRDTGSHLYAAVAGYKWLASHEAVAAAMNATSLVRILQSLAGDTQKLDPFPMPFPDKNPDYDPEVERQAVAELEQHIIIGG